MAAKTSAPALKGVEARDFSGGPNLRDAASELAKNESVDCWNMTFDERGGATSRLGYAKRNSSVYGGGLVSNVYYWQTGSVEIVQAGASLYKGTSTVAVKTFTTSARAVFADIGGYLIAAHPVDGMFSSTDAVTFTAFADPDAPVAVALEVWQNKLFAAVTASSKVMWSDIGLPLAWTAASFNQLREKDNEQIVALKVASGVDISGRAGLCAFKRRSWYRIFDSGTGAYETVDSSVGAASALSVVNIGGKTISLSERGVFWWASGQVGAVNASDRLAPLWDPTVGINMAQLDLFCAGVRKGRAHFSLCRAGSTANDLALEYHPDQGWVAPGSHAMSCYATYGASTEVLIGGSPSVTGQVYNLYTGGTDDGTAIASRFQTRWMETNSGFLSTIWQIRMFGRGTVTATIRKDYEDAAGDNYPVVMDGSGSAYDAGLLYDAGELYAVAARQYEDALFSLGVCRQVSLRITASTSTTFTDNALLGAGTGPTVGAWALYGLEVLYVPLGVA